MREFKKCRRCNKLLPFSAFYKKENYLESFCKKCKLEYNKEIREKYPITTKRNSRRNSRREKYSRKEIKEKYGLGAGTVGRFGFKLALEVYEKCDRKCIECGEVNDLTIHHLNGKGRNFANKGLKPDNNLNNLIVLCRSCHGRLHGKQSWERRKK